MVIIEQSPDFQKYVEFQYINSLKLFSNYVWKVGFFHWNRNQMLFQLIQKWQTISSKLPVNLISSIYQFPMEYMRRLIRNIKFDMCLLKYQKHLIGFSMNVLSLTLSYMRKISRETFWRARFGVSQVVLRLKRTNDLCLENSIFQKFWEFLLNIGCMLNTLPRKLK